MKLFNKKGDTLPERGRVFKGDIMKLTKLWKKFTIAISVLMITALLAACSNPSGGSSSSGNDNNQNQNAGQQGENNKSKDNDKPGNNDKQGDDIEEKDAIAIKYGSTLIEYVSEEVLAEYKELLESSDYTINGKDVYLEASGFTKIMSALTAKDKDFKDKEVASVIVYDGKLLDFVSENSHKFDDMFEAGTDYTVKENGKILELTETGWNKVKNAYENLSVHEEEEETEGIRKEDINVYLDFLEEIGNTVLYCPKSDVYASNGFIITEFFNKLYSIQFSKNQIVITNLENNEKYIFDLKKENALLSAGYYEESEYFACDRYYSFSLKNPLGDDISINYRINQKNTGATTVEYATGKGYTHTTFYTNVLDFQGCNSSKIHKDINKTRLLFYLYNEDLYENNDFPSGYNKENDKPKNNSSSEDNNSSESNTSGFEGRTWKYTQDNVSSTTTQNVVFKNGTVTVTTITKSNNSSTTNKNREETASYELDDDKITITYLNTGYKMSADFTVSVEENTLTLKGEENDTDAIALLGVLFQNMSGTSEMSFTLSDEGSASDSDDDEDDSNSTIKASDIENITWKYQYEYNNWYFEFKNGKVTQRHVIQGSSMGGLEGTYKLKGDKLTVTYQSRYDGSDITGTVRLSFTDYGLKLDAEGDTNAGYVVNGFFEGSDGKQYLNKY